MKNYSSGRRKPLGVLFPLAFIALVGILMMWPAKSYATYLYSIAPSYNSSKLVTIDPLTATIVDTLGLHLSGGGAPHFWTYALAFSPGGGLYGWDSKKGKLFQIDYDTGGITYIGGSQHPKTVTGLAFDAAGNLYGLRPDPNFLATDDKLLSIDLSTGNISTIGAGLGFDLGSNGLAINFSDDQLYAVSGDYNDMVLSIDKTTGVATKIGKLGVNYFGVGAEFDPDSGLLYALRSGNILMSYDILGKVSKVVGKIGNKCHGFHGVSLAAKWPNEGPTVVPEPATLLLLGTGLLGLAGWRRQAV